MSYRPRLSDLARAAFWAIWLLTAGAVLQGALFGDHGLLAVRRQRADLAVLDARNDSLRAEIRSLETEIRALREDPLAIERVAREELLLCSPGETLFVFPSSAREGTALRRLHN